MKKLLFVLTAALMFSCSDDDSNSTQRSGCDNKVFETFSSCNGPACTYGLRVGPTLESATIMNVNEATYNFYEDRLAQDEECFVGLQE
jgi:hypothetical protein